MHYVFSTRGNYRMYELNCYTDDHKSLIQDRFLGMTSNKPSKKSHTPKGGMRFTMDDKRAFIQFLRDLRNE